jgi:hypothetical protein
LGLRRYEIKKMRQFYRITNARGDEHAPTSYWILSTSLSGLQLLWRHTGQRIEEVFGLFLLGSPQVLATALIRMFLQQWILSNIVEHNGKRNWFELKG